MDRGIEVLQTSALPLGYGAILSHGPAGPWHYASTRNFEKSAENTLPVLSAVFLWSGIRDSDSRLSPWQGDTLPLS